jgi:hypothetical protein
MKPFGVTCSMNGCTERNDAPLDEAPAGWRKYGVFSYCPKHALCGPGHYLCWYYDYPLCAVCADKPDKDTPISTPVPVGEGKITGVSAKEPEKTGPSADAVLAATTRLVADVLQAGGRLRFQQAEKICQLAHEFQRVLEPRTEDFLAETGAVEPFRADGLPILGAAVRRWNPRLQQAVGGNNDLGEMMRGMMTAVEGVVGPRAEAERANVAETEARELGLLLDLPDDVRLKFHGRIAFLMERINDRSKGDADAVVHPDVERGLLARGDGAQEDAPAGERPDGG